MNTQPAPLEPQVCPICGAATRQAFGPSRNYVTCVRNGHVSISDEAPR